MKSGRLIAILLCLGSLSLRAATLPEGFTESQFGSNLGDVPTAMDFAPDGRLFVCLQGGQLRVIKDGALLGTPFVSITVDSSGERGLLGVAFDPNFASNQYVYVYHTVPGSPPHNRVSRYTAQGDVAAAGSVTPILDLDNLSSATNHNGGAIHFGPDGKLYVAVGENANAANSQSLNNRLGKILRINSDGSIPSDNPTSFAGISGSPSAANQAIWAVGLRNPFTFAFQPGPHSVDRLFINDVGQNTFEEINDGHAGSNYGWNICEGFCTPPNGNYLDPLFTYSHSDGCAIVGGAFYNPSFNQFPASYIDKYFFGDLCGGWIRVFDPGKGSASDFASGISTPVDLKIGPDGRLYYLAQNGGNGQVWQVSATPSLALNISTRCQIATSGDAVGGFIIDGTANKQVILRGLGPSLSQFNVPNPLPDPLLELHGSGGELISSNNNWRDTQESEIIATNIAPTNDLESAIVADLAPGSYTAVVKGNTSASGASLVEIYDLDSGSASRLANISTRSLVQTGDSRLIGGFILGANIGAAKIIARALGPSLAGSGVTNPLADPTLELWNSNGVLVGSNDNWQEIPSQAADITANNLALTNELESAISIMLLPDAYTVIVAGKNNGVGTGLVEVYNIP